MSHKCVMCGQPIGKKDGEWGMEFSLAKWMHYKCIEHLWDVYSSMKQPTPEGGRMMDEEKTRKVLDNLVRDIAVSTKRSEALSQLTNKELAEKLISDVWGISKLFGEKSDLLTEVIERLFTLDTPDRVRCTKDGEYPEDDITVLTEFHGVDFADIPHLVWFEWDNAQWVDFLTEEIVPNVPEEMTVYWQPLTSLKEQYERQKDGE